MHRKNIKLVYILVFVLFFMTCLTYASVPLYNLFCKVTGYGGTINRTMIFDIDNFSSQKIIVHFNSEVDKNLPWTFIPLQNTMSTKLGQGTLAFYKLKNNSDKEISGMAIYNVSPHIVGKYFNKVACFCFEKITIDPYQELLLPVSFYIDKKILENIDAKNIKVITLSYTFFPYNE